MSNASSSLSSCSQFAYFQTTDGPAPAQIFGPSSFIPVSFYAKMCSDIYGDDFNAQSVAANVEWTNEYYGGVDLSGTNILGECRSSCLWCSNCLVWCAY